MPEAVVVLGIISAVIGIGSVSYREFQGSFKKNEARYNLDSDLRRLRNEAVSSGGRAIVTVAANGKSYTGGIDLYPYSSTGVPDKKLFQRNLPVPVTLTTGQTIVFDPRGYLVTVEGGYTTTSVTLFSDGTQYYSATLYTTGALS